VLSVPDGYLVVLIITIGAELAAPHYLVSEGVADGIIFETVRNHDLHACVVKGGIPEGPTPRLSSWAASASA
jgi:hypothetical protein